MTTESVNTVRHRASLWRHGDFLRLWSAQSISQVGTQVTTLALPLTAIVLLRASPAQVGMLRTAQYLPFLVIGLPAGVWVDRLRRRPILIGADVGRAAVFGLIPAAYALHALQLTELYAVALAAGCLTVFFDVSYQSYLPSLVEREQLYDGNAKLEISRSAAQLAGPGLGGILIQLLSAPVAIAADALSYAASALFILSIRPDSVDHPSAGGERRRMGQQLVEGLRFILGHRLLRPVAICTAMSNLAFGGAIMSVILIYATRVLQLRPAQIGVVFVIGNAGALLAAFLAGAAGSRLASGRVIVGASALAGLGALLLPMATTATALPVLSAGMVVVALGSIMYNITQVSLRQTLTPERLLGRVNATMRSIVWGAIPVGSTLGGLLASTIGIRPTLWLAAAASIAAFLPLLLSPVVRLRSLPIGPDRQEEAA